MTPASAAPCVRLRPPESSHCINSSPSSNAANAAACCTFRFFHLFQLKLLHLLEYQYFFKLSSSGLHRYCVCLSGKLQNFRSSMLTFPLSLTGPFLQHRTDIMKLQVPLRSLRPPAVSENRSLSMRSFCMGARCCRSRPGQPRINVVVPSLSLAKLTRLPH